MIEKKKECPKHQDDLSLTNGWIERFLTQFILIVISILITILLNVLFIAVIYYLINTFV